MLNCPGPLDEGGTGQQNCKLPRTREVESTYTSGDITVINFERTPSSALALLHENFSLLKAHN
jgi:hypothetical protein